MSEETKSARQSILRSLWGIIVRPRATLTYFKDHGKRAWWVPAILAVLLVVAPLVVAGPITAEETREAILASQEEMAEQRGVELTDEQREQMVSYGASPLITTVFPAAAGALGLIVGWLVWAGGLYLAGMALGGRSTFGTMFRTVVWTWIPFVLRGLVQTVYILASGQAIANPGLSGFVQSDRSIAELVATPPSLDQILVVSLLSRVDLFLIWHLILLIIGIKVVTQLSRRKATLVTLAVWLLLTALSLVPALVGGFFAQQTGGF